MMDKMNVIFEKFRTNPYGAIVAIGLLLWILFALSCSKAYKKRSSVRTTRSGVLQLFAVSLPIGLVFARLFWCIANYHAYLLHPETIYRIWEGGLSLWGFIIGFVLSVRMFSARLGISPALSLDAFSPGLILFIALIRISETYTGQGVGRIISFEFLVNPFTAVYDMYMEPHFAVYRFEALYALILFFVVLFRSKKHFKNAKRMRGDLWRFAVGGYAMAQIVFESMRDDDYMRFGFVRISQAFSILILLIFAFYFVWRLKKAHLLKKHYFWMVPLALLSTALVIVQEFRVDAALHTEIEHLFMLIYAFFLYLPSLFAMNKLLRRRRKSKASHQRG